MDSMVFELKLEKGTSFAFSRVAEHQIEALRQAKHSGLYHKISDMPQSFYGGNKHFRFVKPKPFDGVYLRGVNAFVVLMFYKPRQPKIAYLIDVDMFVKERDSAIRKSLIPGDAARISRGIIYL